MNISIEYDGDFPNLCAGTLIVHVDDKTWNFGRALLTDGCAWIDENSEAQVDTGPWSLKDYPDDFPEEYLEALLEHINKTIPWGCCGGCI